MGLELMSPAFTSGSTIPAKHTCEGENVSPPLSWAGAPPETKSLALIFDDPDAPRGTFSHWVLYGIPADERELPENYATSATAQRKATSGRNDFGKDGYGGPCPPRGETHRFYFRLYALDTPLNLSAGATRAQVLDRVRDHVVAQAELMGSYKRT